MTEIYGLIDPRSGLIRYVGKSTVSSRARLMAHLRAARAGRCQYRSSRWIRSLLDSQMLPRLVVFESVHDSEWLSAERRWIAHFRILGHLTNLTEGGEGISGAKHSESTKNKIGAANRGRTRSMQLRTEMSAYRKGKPTRPCSEETRRKISDAQIGKPREYARRKQSEQDRAKKSASAIKRYSDPAQRVLASEIANKWIAKKRAAAV